MKILQINTYLTGSIGKIAKEIHAFAEPGSSMIAYGKGPSSNNPAFVRFTNTFFTRTDHLLSRITGLSGIFSVLPTLRLIRLIRTYQPDIVHLHNLHGYYVNIYILVRFLIKRKIRTVWTLHDEYMYTGNCGSAVPCDKWLSGCGKCPAIHEYPPSLIFDQTSFLLKKKKKLIAGFEKVVFITPSKWLASRARRSILASKKIETLANGIDCSLFSPRAVEKLKEKHKLKQEKIVLAVAPDLFDGRKGGEFVLRLADSLKEEAIKFILIGTGKKEITENGNVIQIPKTEDQLQLAAYYSLADTFVICSKSENFPTVCLEALACGTPVVGFATGGTAETAPGELGMFVEYGNMEQLRKATLHMTGQKKRLTEACRNYALTHYSSRLMAQNYFTLYHQSMHNHV